jgi:mRNA interferase YafQ
LIIESLAHDIPLPQIFRDHELIGDWKDHRECHLKGNLLLIYQKTGDLAGIRKEQAASKGEQPQ